MADGDIRRAEPDDVDEIIDMIRELADYEQALHEAVATPDQLRLALFGPRPAVFAHVVEHAGDGHRLGGFALWFLNFSTWLGVHGIYLEDLYVRRAIRGSGYGSRLLSALADECVENGYGRLEWWVLDCLPETRAFYASQGAEELTQWVPCRVSGDALPRLARRAASPTQTGD